MKDVKINNFRTTLIRLTIKQVEKKKEEVIWE